MKITFEYNRGNDIWCLLNKGPGSSNSSEPTKVYKQLVEEVGDTPNEEETSKFIDKYIKEGNYNIQTYIDNYQKKFDYISDEFIKIAERVFGVSLENDVTVYLTVNGRCPYNLKENYFFVTILDKPEYSPNKIAMHELWHFYTWRRYGEDWIKKIGPKKYNDIKEALTVLLNIECKHLLSENSIDKGYPQHQELRDKLVELWKERQDIDYIWSEGLKFLD